MPKGFGNSQATNIDELVVFAVNHRHKQNPEGLDKYLTTCPLS